MMTSKSTPGGFHSTTEHYHSGLEPLFQEIQERREECDRLRQEMENVKVQKAITFDGLYKEIVVIATPLL